MIGVRSRPEAFEDAEFAAGTVRGGGDAVDHRQREDHGYCDPRGMLPARAVFQPAR